MGMKLKSGTMKQCGANNVFSKTPFNEGIFMDKLLEKIIFSGFAVKGKMEATWGIILSLVILALMLWAWRMLNWLWLRPKKLEKLLREQGLKGNQYRFFVGDLKELLKMRKEAKSKPMNLSDDTVPRVFAYVQHSVNKYGSSFVSYSPKALPQRWFFSIQLRKHEASTYPASDIGRMNYNNTFFLEDVARVLCRNFLCENKHSK
ncbi:hypothetical protein OROGR_002337 [Orobanche gracilis]